MGINTQKLLQEGAEFNRLYNAPINKRFKYCALAVITITIALLLAMIIWMEDLSATSMLIMRGCAGLGAIIFVVLVGLLTYRVNCQHIQNRNNKNSRKV